MEPFKDFAPEPKEFGAATIFAFLNCIYLGLAAVGTWRYRSNPGSAVLVLYLVIRTALLTQLPTIEPRYVVVCFPAVAALGALAFVKSRQDRSAAAREDSVEASAAYVR